MKKHQLRLRKRITFEEWKARKDRELKREKEMKNMVDERASNERIIGEKRLLISGNELIKKVIEMPQEHRKIDQSGSNMITSLKKEVSKPNDYIVKESGKLTFREWLHNKNVMERDRIRRKQIDQLDNERRKRERAEIVNKAYKVWLIRSKYRTLQEYYPQLGEDKIRDILLKDVSKLSLITTKEIGVGDASVDHVLSRFQL